MAVNDLDNEAIRKRVLGVTGPPRPSVPKPARWTISGPCVTATAIPGRPVAARASAR